MKSFKFLLIGSLVVFSLIISSHTFAEDTVAPAPAIVATVNIIDGRIIVQNKNVFTIAFTLTNRTGIQTGVKYGIQLVKDGAKYVSDEKVYDESLTLAENSDVKREVTYTAPAGLDGSYTLILSSNNESNFPFAVATLGTVKLTATNKKGFEILTDSCYVKVEGDKSNTHYTLLQSVDISKEETLRLNCNTLNSSGNALSLTPTFETRYYSSYGNKAETTGGETTAISFKAQKNENFSILLPKGTASQFYNLKVSLSNGTTTSNSISVRYIVRGVNAIIQKATLDKDFYGTGDKGSLSLIWSATAGNFSRGGTQSSTIPEVNFSAKLASGDGKECASPITQKLVRDFKNPQTVIPFTVKTSCKDPVISATITDASGSVLDQKSFAFTSTSTKGGHNNISPRSIYIILGIVGLLIIIGIIVSVKKKKEPQITI